jgi:hypothetical protein
MGLLEKHCMKDKQTGEHGALHLWALMEQLAAFQQSELSRSIPEAYQVIGEPGVEILDLGYTLRLEK